MGTVVESGTTMKVLVEGELHPCAVGGRLRVKSSFPVVGDRVQVELRPGQAVAVSLEPRRTLLSRLEHPRGRAPPRLQAIAANIDQALLVATFHEPEFKTHLVDRLICAAIAGGLRPIVAVNKLDLAAPGEVEAIQAIYAGAGVPLEFVSAADGRGLAGLAAWLRQGSSVMVGQSGVGKTSLVNRLLGTDLRTSKLTQSTGKGRHTTTVSRMLPLAAGGFLADLPGFRTLPLAPLDETVLLAAFPEIGRHGFDCRFRDCSHTVEQGCAVLAALAAGEIPASRHISYVRLLQGGDSPGQGGS